MSLPDTAEYWQDVKRPRGGNPMVYHDPFFECGHLKRAFHELAKIKEDVNCNACRKNINTNGTVLPSEKCECGRKMVARRNKSSNEWFLGCTRYPKCNNTRSFVNNK